MLADYPFEHVRDSSHAARSSSSIATSGAPW